MEAYIHEAAAHDARFVIRFSGCDYKCRYCNAPEIVEFRTGETIETRDLKTAIDASACTEAFFTGGEPLLQRQALAELLRHCKAKGMRTVVDTNAGKPKALRALVDENLVDEFLVDVKASAATFGEVTNAATFFRSADALFADFAASIAFLKTQTRATVSFRTVVTPGLIYRKEDILELAALLDGCDAEWTLAPFDPERTLDPAMHGVAPPTQQFLENLASFVRKAHPDVRIRVAER